MDKITISIITVTYNAEEFVINCINSVRSQSLKAEHIIIDGGSTDRTNELIESNKDAISAHITEPDQGLYDAMNKGIQLASGDIIGILNSDDFYTADNVLEKVASVFIDPEIKSCYSDLIYVDRYNTAKITRHWRSGNYNQKYFYSGWMPPHPTFFVRREIYEKHGYYNLNMGTAADYEVMLRFLLKHQVTSKYIPETLVAMRRGGMSNASIRNRILANRMDRYAWSINGLKPYPWTTVLKPFRKVTQLLF